MEEKRRKPEEILAKIKEEEASLGRGRLKIFLGAAAGVGKTYTMLEAAQKLKKDGIDIVGGVVVTHGRKETEVLLSGLEIIPYQTIEYKNAQLSEFNLDAALKRKPQVILIDELAHTNAPGSRHEKRWQDVEELLQAGINVFTTVNIQHLESVNDLIAQITTIQVKETVPDSIFENAYEVELVDLPPDELIQRLKEGKVYVHDYAETALEHFFRKGNLIALRELALRITAEHVDAQMLKYRETSSIHDVWPVNDRILVCIGPSPLSAKLVRATKRMANSIKSEWIAVHVETPGAARITEKDRNRVIRTLQMAERLGARTAQLSGVSASEELVKFAQSLNVSKIVIGKPARPRWQEIIFGSVVDDLIRQSGNIDVYVITGEKSSIERRHIEATPTDFRMQDYVLALLAVAIATGLSGFLFPHFAAVNLVMIYQLAIVLVALNLGRGPSSLAALASVAAFDFFFVPPYFSFAVADTQYLITFLVMLTVGLTLSTLTSQVKQRAVLARQRERQTAALYAMTREQATAISVRHVTDISLKHIADISQSKVVMFLATANKVVPVSNMVSGFEIDSKEAGVAQWVYLNQQAAGAGTSTLTGAKALYLPLIGSRGAIGVVGILPDSTNELSKPDERHLLETVVNQTALAIERAQLSEGQKG